MISSRGGRIEKRPMVAADSIDVSASERNPTRISSVATSLRVALRRSASCLAALRTSSVNVERGAHDSRPVDVYASFEHLCINVSSG